MKKTCANPECNKVFETNRSAVNYCSRSCSNKDRQRVVMADAKEYQIMSCGGGVQSTAMIALVYSGRITPPDLVLMVDTGYEKRGTVDYAHNVLIPACNSKGVEFKILKTPDPQIINEKGMITIPAFKLMEDGTVQKLYTMCSGSWKMAVMRRHIRSIGINKAKSWIGISTDEAQRQRQSNVDWIGNRYPLLEEGMSRYQCLYLIRSLGWPDPARSSCIMCPLQADEEYELMKYKYPEDYQRVVDIDNCIERHNPKIFLHKSMTRMRDIIWQVDQMKELSFIPSVPCEICL